MHMQIEFLYANFVNQSVYLTFQLVCKQDARLYFSLSKAGRAGFVYTYIHCRAHALPCNLHQSKLT